METCAEIERDASESEARETDTKTKLEAKLPKHPEHAPWETLPDRLTVRCQASRPDREVNLKGGMGSKALQNLPNKISNPEAILSTVVGGIINLILHTCTLCQVALKSLPLETECTSPSLDFGVAPILAGCQWKGQCHF